MSFPTGWILYHPIDNSPRSYLFLNLLLFVTFLCFSSAMLALPQRQDHGSLVPQQLINPPLSLRARIYSLILAFTDKIVNKRGKALALLIVIQLIIKADHKQTHNYTSWELLMVTS